MFWMIAGKKICGNDTPAAANESRDRVADMGIHSSIRVSDDHPKVTHAGPAAFALHSGKGALVLALPCYC
jgi:hypothetical protein